MTREKQMISIAGFENMQNIGNGGKAEVQLLCAEILDDLEMLTNLIFLLKDGQFTAADRRLYLNLADEKMKDLRLIVRRRAS
jgi:hypothetical protein